MIRDPEPPSIGIVGVEEQERARQLQHRIDVATTLSAAGGMSFTEALAIYDRDAGGEPPADAGASVTDLASTTFLALCDDSQAMHDVVLACMAERCLTYMEGLNFLLERHDEAAQWLSGDERDAITLSAVLADTGVSMARVMTLVADQQQVRSLAAPSAGMVKREIDDWGQVRRGLGEDLDELLADPLAVRRDFRRARDLGLVADDGIPEPDDSPEFKTWEGAWRNAVNQGADLLATLELREGERQAELAAQRQVDEIEQKAQQARIDAARKTRELGNKLLEDARRLDAGQ